MYDYCENHNLDPEKVDWHYGTRWIDDGDTPQIVILVMSDAVNISYECTMNQQLLWSDEWRRKIRAGHGRREKETSSHREALI
jgi:hypothetical protein